MVTEDDSRATVELTDRYVIEPPFHWWQRRSFAEDGTPRVPEGFHYRSDTNSQWVNATEVGRVRVAQV